MPLLGACVNLTTCTGGCSTHNSDELYLWELCPFLHATQAPNAYSREGDVNAHTRTHTRTRSRTRTRSSDRWRLLHAHLGGPVAAFAVLLRLSAQAPSPFTFALCSCTLSLERDSTPLPTDILLDLHGTAPPATAAVASQADQQRV
eukprot:6199125-Pleurochrysis_carterae.AAC.3